jgi:hypothetical protein
MLQVWVWAVAPQAIPPYRAAVVVARVRVWVPVPQVEVQVDQADQVDWTQSMAQMLSPQLRLSTSLGQT